MNRSIVVAVVAVVAIIVVVVVLASSSTPTTTPPPTSSAAPSSTPSGSSPGPTQTTSIAAPTTTTAPSTIVPTATTVASPTPGTSLGPFPDRTPPPGPIKEVPGVATDLRSLGFCDPASPSTPAMDLSWVATADGAQLVAIATRPDGFQTGRYTVSADLPAGLERFALSPVEPGGIYYWRVQTRSGDGWAASEIATFTGTTCVVDAS